MEIAPCPVIEPGPGRVCTGKFQHSHGRIWELRLEGSEEPIRGTGTHPIFSADRLEWVELRELREGESVQVRGGFAKVLIVVETEDVARVYTLEIDGDHCYRVGELGLLVHNKSIPMTLNPQDVGKPFGCEYNAGTYPGSTSLGRMSSPSLEANIGTMAGYAAHHLIGVIEAQNSDIMKWAAMLGYHINGKNNGGLYPTYSSDNTTFKTYKEGCEESLRSGLAIHSVRHGRD